jgi:hypothetical protein
VSVEPVSVDFGTVDFKEWPTDMPSEGYGSTSVMLTNDGDDTVNLTLISADFERLCLLGISESMVPYSWPDLATGKTLILPIGVCSYSAEEGDRDTLVEGEILIRSTTHEGDLTIPWSFTPTIDMGDDTGA